MKRTKTDALKTRNHIIECGLELFLEQGFSVTKLDDIAIKAGVTRGAIYWHFKDKLDILDELVEQQHSNMQFLLNKLFSSTGDPLMKIHTVIDGLINNFYFNKIFRDFVELTWFKIEYTQFAKLIRTKSELSKFCNTQLKSIVLNAQKSGKIKNDINPDDIATTIGFMIDGMYRSYFLNNKNANHLELSCKAFKTYIELIKK